MIARCAAVVTEVSEIFVPARPPGGPVRPLPLLDACVSAGFGPAWLTRRRVRCACSALRSALHATCVCSHCSSLLVTRLESQSDVVESLFLFLREGRLSEAWKDLRECVRAPPCTLIRALAGDILLCSAGVILFESCAQGRDL